MCRSGAEQEREMAKPELLLSGKALVMALGFLYLVPKASSLKQPEIFQLPIKALSSMTGKFYIQQEGMFYPLGGFLNSSSFTPLL